jgi:carbon monoxide dehydrogenase subunit G
MAITFELVESIAAPPERVFAVLADLDAAGKWMPNFVRIERLTEGKYGPGARWRETRKMYRREATEEFEVTAMEPPRSLELYVDGAKGSSKRGYYRFRYRLEPAAAGAGTRVILAGEMGGLNWLMELFGRLMAGTFKKAIAKDLAAMKAYIEGTAP